MNSSVGNVSSFSSGAGKNPEIDKNISKGSDITKVLIITNKETRHNNYLFKYKNGYKTICH